MDYWLPDKESNRPDRHRQARRRGATCSGRGRKTGKERVLPSRLKVRPRRVFLRAIPVLSKSRFAEQGGLIDLAGPILVEDRDDRAPRRHQPDRLLQANSALLVNHGFNLSDHALPRGTRVPGRILHLPSFSIERGFEPQVRSTGWVPPFTRHDTVIAMPRIGQMGPRTGQLILAGAAYRIRTTRAISACAPWPRSRTNRGCARRSRTPRPACFAAPRAPARSTSCGEARPRYTGALRSP